jgi:hypothetical protein
MTTPMSNVSVLKTVPRPRESDYLGPATVVAARGSAVDVELPGGDVAQARLALAYPYQPVAGDVLLVIGRGDACYVIGVLEGTGATVLSFPGAVELRARGALTLAGGEGVQIEGPEVGVDAGKLRVMAGTVVEKFGSLYQRVSAMLSVRAEEAETIIDKGSLTRAKSATILTEETMTINGKQIHLG